MFSFYFPNPNSDGIFVNSRKRKDFVDGVSLYLFEPYEDNEQKARFSLINSPSVCQMISEAKGWESYIKPACDYGTYPKKKINSIETTTMGEAELLLPSRNWKVVKKAKIKYTESDAPVWYKEASPSPDTPTQPLEEEIEPLEEELVDTATEPDTTQEITDVTDSKNNTNSINTFFFSNPIGNIFKVSKKTETFIEGKSLYRFEKVAGKNSANVFVENMPSVVKRFIDSPEVQMGVCESIWSYNKNAIGIETIEPGEAILDGDKWIVEKKVKIRYISQSFDTKTGLPAFEPSSLSDHLKKQAVLPPHIPPPPPPPPTPSLPVEKKSKVPIIAAVLAVCIIAVSFLTRPSVETLFNKGKEQFEAQNFTESVKYFSKAIKRNSGNAEFYAWRGRAFYELKKHEAAIADFKEATRVAPKMAEYHSRLGEVYSDTAVKNYDGAVTAYTQAIKLEPDNANHYFGRAGAHSGKKSYSAAIDDFTQAIRLDPRDARYWNSRGGDYRNMGDYDKAYADHTEAIRLNPSDAKYHNNKGVAQVLRKKYIDAIPDFSEAIRLAPDNARYYNNRGDAYVLNKDIALAAADYRMAVKLDPANEKYRRNLEKTEQRLSEQEEPTDSRDGQKYRAVKIGGKIWLAQNMKYKPQGGNSWCYEDNSSNCEKYGRLYDWNTAKTVCMSGWHLPSRKEWKDLVTAMGAFSTSGKKLKVALPEWNGTDDYKFSALPGGFRNEDGSFSAIGTDGSWWTATENNSRNAYLQYMGYDYGNVLEVEYDKSNGISVRCVMDAR